MRPVFTGPVHKEWLVLFISRGKRDSPGSVGVANGGGPSEKAARGKLAWEGSAILDGAMWG